MIEALKCPECSAPLQYPAQGRVTMRCPYCNATVLLPGRAQAPAYERKPAASIPARGDSPATNRVVSDAMKIGCGAVFGTAVLVVLIFSLIVASVHRKQRMEQARVTVRRSFVSPPAPFTPPDIAKLISPPPPPESAFARQVLEFGKEGIGAGGFTDARSIAVDNQGHVYVGEYSDGRVQVFDAQGKFISTWSVGTGSVLLNLAADRHGTVYAVTPSHLYRYQGLTGKPMGEFVSIRDDNGNAQTLSDIFPALNGDLYAIGSNNEIVIIGPNGQIKKVIDAEEKVGERLSLIRVLEIGTGEIFVMDSSKGIFKFAPDGRYINRFGASAPVAARHEIPGHLFSPRNFAADGKGRIYVTESGASVLVFDSDGAYVGSFGGTEIVFGLAITDDDEIYGCFRNRCSVRKFVLNEK